MHIQDYYLCISITAIFSCNLAISNLETGCCCVEWTNDSHSEFSAFVYGEYVGLSKCSIVLLLQMSIINYSSYLQTTLWSNFVAHHLTPTLSLFKCPSFKIQATKYDKIITNVSLQQSDFWHLIQNISVYKLNLKESVSIGNKAARDS